MNTRRVWSLIAATAALFLLPFPWLARAAAADGSSGVKIPVRDEIERHTLLLRPKVEERTLPILLRRPAYGAPARAPRDPKAFDETTDTLTHFGGTWQTAAVPINLVPVPPPAQAAHGGSVRPRYTGDGELEVPKGFRSWVFVGADLSPTYKPDRPEPTRREQRGDGGKAAGDFHNIYMNRESYDAYLENGRFPDPTILVMEVFRAEREDAKGILKSGEFEGKRIALEAAVKDGNRPGGGVPWAYYAFDIDANGKPAKSARAFPDRSCYDCHLKHASKDNVWVQFYPALRDPE